MKKNNYTLSLQLYILIASLDKIDFESSHETKRYRAVVHRGIVGIVFNRGG